MYCPCESGLKSEDCCLLPDGDWFKNPTSFTPQPPQTGFSHPDCYLFHTKDCSTKMSDEHYVSETVLKAVDDVLKVSGFPWLKPGESKKIPASRLYRKILCTRHNNAFGQIDAQGGRFVRWIKILCDSSISPPQPFSLFNGADIERWLLKTFWGLLFSTNLQIAPGKAIKKVKNSPRIVDLLFGRVPNAWGRGLWVRTDPKLIVDTELLLSVSPVSKPGTNQLFGFTLNIFGFDFLYSTAPINVETSVFRPSEINFKRHKSVSKIIISWPANIVHSGQIEWRWAGKRKLKESKKVVSQSACTRIAKNRAR